MFLFQIQLWQLIEPQNQTTAEKIIKEGVREALFQNRSDKDLGPNEFCLVLPIILQHNDLRYFKLQSMIFQDINTFSTHKDEFWL